MNHEATIETIKVELEKADAETLQSIWTTLRKAKRDSPELPVAVGGFAPFRPSSAIVSGKPLEFIGDNLPFEPCQHFSFKERAAIKRRLKTQNREWLLQKFKDLKAAWMMVVDGHVIASGKTLSDYPKPEQILSVCQDTVKFPFIFINENVLAIEESGSVWHSTNEPNDFYPTVPIKLCSKT